VDVLSDVVSAIRVGQPACERVEWSGPWEQRFPDQPGTAGFLVVLQGSCRLIEDSAEPVRLGRGDVVFSPHGNGYTLADEAATVTLCGGYHLAPNWTHPLLRELPGTIQLPAYPERHPDLETAVRILGSESTGRRLGADALVPIALDLLLVYILRACFDGRPGHETGTGWAAALTDPPTSAALNAIHDRPAHPWTVRELADEARLSRAAFSRRFHTLTGQPPMTYLTWWRMTLAAERLREPANSIHTVAADIGYTSEFAFSAAFKRHFGVAPGRFRRGQA
jgi:AraC-like DNA-binding protein